MTLIEWVWLALVAGVCVMDYVLYRLYGAPATLSHLIWRTFAFGESGREKRFWRVRRCLGALILVVLLQHFLQGGSWLPL